MNIQQRIEAFVALGKYIKTMPSSDLQSLAWRAQNANSWFTEQSITMALEAIALMLEPSALAQWTAKYRISETFSHKKVGLVLAGNIPAVGFHDWLCVLMAGHEAHLKLSTLDSVLMRWLVQQLEAVAPSFAGRTIFAERMNEVDAIIATGSDNSAKYFAYYFAKKPHIIRHNRTSVAVLGGHETANELQQLGKDIFTYYGLGCRNVSKVYVPENYDFTPMLDAQVSYGEIIHHHKYNNNYDYNKSIYLVNGVQHLDTGFLLVTQSQELVSPISVLYYETYNDAADLQAKIAANAHKIQCVVAASAEVYPTSVALGRAQCPTLYDYPDGLDTLQFLTKNL